MLLGGWTNEGIETFNRLAREVDSDRKKHGSSFEKAFKKKIDKEVANSRKSEKRKQEYVDTYNDLQVAEIADSEDDEESAYRHW